MGGEGGISRENGLINIIEKTSEAEASVEAGRSPLISR